MNTERESMKNNGSQMRRQIETEGEMEKGKKERELQREQYRNKER